MVEMSKDTVVIRNTETGEIGEIRRSLFESPVFNPNGLLVEVDDTRSGCVDCGIAPADCDDDCEDDFEPEISYELEYTDTPEQEED